MKTKKFVSALAGMTIAAGMLSAFAVTASAQEVTLSYEKDGAALSTYQYEKGSNVEYTLTQAGKDALKNAQEDDTVTVTYNIGAAGESRYRAGLNFIGHQFYINAGAENSINKHSDGTPYFDRGGACHFNTILNADTSASVEYFIELNAGGTVAAVTPTVAVGTVELTYNRQTTNVAGKTLDSLTLNTGDRGSKYSGAPTLTNFSAVLNTSYEEPTPEDGPTEATEYTPKEYEGEDKGYTVTLNGNGNAVKWYAKPSKDAAWTEIATAQNAEQTIMSGDADYVVGLVITDIGDNSLEGYSFGAEMATVE